MEVEEEEEEEEEVAVEVKSRSTSVESSVATSMLVFTKTLQVGGGKNGGEREG